MIVSSRRLLAETLWVSLKKHLDGWDVASADDPFKAVDVALQLKARVAIACPDLPSNGIYDFLRRLRATTREARAIVLDQDDTPTVAREAVRLGAAGYYTQADSLEALISAIREVMLGGYSFRPELSRSISFTPDGILLLSNRGDCAIDLLTERERDIFLRLASGDTVREAARILGISASTVDNHKTRLMRKLGVRRTVDLVRLAIREKLVPI